MTSDSDRAARPLKALTARWSENDDDRLLHAGNCGGDHLKEVGTPPVVLGQHILGIRLALIGAGTTPETAARFCAACAVRRPVVELFPLAFAILKAHCNGREAEEVAA